MAHEKPLFYIPLFNGPPIPVVEVSTEARAAALREIQRLGQEIERDLPSKG